MARFWHGHVWLFGGSDTSKPVLFHHLTGRRSDEIYQLRGFEFVFFVEAGLDWGVDQVGKFIEKFLFARFSIFRVTHCVNEYQHQNAETLLFRTPSRNLSSVGMMKALSLL